MMEPQLGFGWPYTVAGYSAALLILASIYAASRGLAPAVASICPCMIICNTCALIVCSNSLSAWKLAGSNPYAAISAAVWQLCMHYEHYYFDSINNRKFGHKPQVLRKEVKWYNKKACPASGSTVNLVGLRQGLSSGYCSLQSTI